METAAQIKSRELAQHWINHVTGLSLLTRYDSAESTLIIDLLVVPKLERRTGIGSQILLDLTSMADEHKIILALSPSDAFGIAAPLLEVFYRRFGFRISTEHTSKNSESMIRYPNQ